MEMHVKKVEFKKMIFEKKKNSYFSWETLEKILGIVPRNWF